MLFCENCGNKVSETAKFCGNCGGKIGHIIQVGKMGSFDMDESQPVYNKNNTLEPSLYDLIRYKSNDVNFDNEGQAVAELDGKWGVINSRFEWVVKPDFEELGDYMLGRTFDEKGYLIAKKNGKTGFINRQGNWVVQPSFFLLGEFDYKDFCQAYVDNKFGWIDRNGDWIIEPIFEYDHVDFLDSEDIFIHFDKYDYCRAYSEGKYGFIDRQGNWKVPPKFDFLGHYDDLHYCIAKSESKYGFIDRLGNWKVPPEFDLLGEYDYLNYCHAKFESKYGFIDRYGKWILEPIFEAVGYFDKNGYAKAVIGSESGFINRKGVLQIHPEVERNFINSKYDLNYFYLGTSEGLYKIFSNKFHRLLLAFLFIDIKTKNLRINIFGSGIPENELNNFPRHFNPDFISNCQFHLYFDESLFGKQDYGFAIVENYGSLFLLIHSKSSSRIYQFLNIEYVHLNENDSGINNDFETYLRSKRQKRYAFFQENILPLFSIKSSIFRKKVIENFENFLVLSADLQLVSDDGHRINQLQVEEINEIKPPETYSAKHKDGANIR